MNDHDTPIAKPSRRVFRVITGGNSTANSDATPHIKTPERLGDILAEPLPEWQVDGLIPRASTVVLFGDSQAGKTFFALDLAASIATGRPLNGRQVRQGAVLYIAAEGHGGFGKRLRALVQRFPELPSSPFLLVRQAIDFRAHNDELLALARNVEKEWGRLGLIVIDTVSQTIFGDENGTDMTDYIGCAGKLASETGAPVMPVHHQGKDASKGARGNSSLRGNSDVMIRLTADAAGNRVATTDLASGGKSRDGETISIGFRLRSLEVGGGQTSCVVDYQDARVCGMTKAKAWPSGDKQFLLYGMIGEMLKVTTASGQGGAPAGRPCIKVEDVVSRWRAAVPGRAGQPQYMHRTLTPMVDKGLVASGEGWLWTS